MKNRKKGRICRQMYSICDALVPEERNFGLFSDQKYKNVSNIGGKKFNKMVYKNKQKY